MNLFFFMSKLLCVSYHILIKQLAKVNRLRVARNTESKRMKRKLCFVSSAYICSIVVVLLLFALLTSTHWDTKCTSRVWRAVALQVFMQISRQILCFQCVISRVFGPLKSKSGNNRVISAHDARLKRTKNPFLMISFRFDHFKWSILLNWIGNKWWHALSLLNQIRYSYLFNGQCVYFFSSVCPLMRWCHG